MEKVYDPAKLEKAKQYITSTGVDTVIEKSLTRLSAVCVQAKDIQVADCLQEAVHFVCDNTTDEELDFLNNYEMGDVTASRARWIMDFAMRISRHIGNWLREATNQNPAAPKNLH